VERALGEPGKDLDHRIEALVLIHVGELEHIRTVGHESTAQKLIHHKDIHNHVDKVKQFAEKTPHLFGIPLL